MNLCKKVPGKNVSGKINLEIKSLNFLKSLEKMALEIVSCVCFYSWDFSSKVWGLPIKSQEKRSQEI